MSGEQQHEKEEQEQEEEEEGESKAKRARVRVVSVEESRRKRGVRAQLVRSEETGGLNKQFCQCQFAFVSIYQ